MSKLLILRSNQSVYITDDQAERLYAELNDNPNMRLVRLVTGQGYRYFPPSSIVDIAPAFGENYRSNEQIATEQERFLHKTDPIGNGRKSIGA